MIVLAVKLLTYFTSDQLISILIKSKKSLKSQFKILLPFFCILNLVAVILPKTVLASDNFKTDYNVSYTVQEDGITRADMKVALTNTSSDYYYASSYKIELGFDDITNITASDLGGKLAPKSEKTENGYSIQLDFNKSVVGEGSKQEFTLSFNTTDIAKKVGKIWEINIPGIDNKQGFNSFNVDLKVPSSFGSPEYIKPSQNNKNLQFNKEQLTESGISLAFGDNQQYSFTLLYHLQNRNLFPIRTEIAIPMNTNYQDVFIDSIYPEPLQVRRDTDGNWLAAYELNPAEQIEVKAKGKVNIYLEPRHDPYTKSQLDLYLKEKPHWQISNQNIREIAKSLKTPKNIYDYVVETLEYDYSRITNSNNRLGAIKILEKPKSAVCLEFTDLFITLARAAGIPAREVDGYAFTDNRRQRPLSLVADILHAWPEYYDFEKETWVMIDPTWADTTNGVDYFYTLDFDHFAFVKKGENSNYPIPAGGYKLIGDENKKDVFVWATVEEFKKESKIIIESPAKNSYLGGMPIREEINIINKGPAISRNQNLYVYSSLLKPANQTVKIDELLPYEKRKISFTFEKQPFLTNKNDTITMQIADQKYLKSIQIIPIYYDRNYIFGGFLIVILTLTIFIITIKTRRIRIS